MHLGRGREAPQEAVGTGLAEALRVVAEEAMGGARKSRCSRRAQNMLSPERSVSPGSRVD